MFGQRTRIAIGLFSWALAASAATAADDAVLEELYGKGVHAYFAGQLNDARSNLTSAIEAGSKDPRAYYFRGMTHLRLGQSKQAESDMKQGAVLETADANQLYPVSKSLERIQGSSRMTLERYRATARAQQRKQKLAIDSQRYERARRDEDTVLRRVKPETLAADAAEGPTQSAAKAAAPPTPAGDDPFADEPAPAAKSAAKAADDPFGDAAADDKMPAEPEPAEAPPAKAGDDDPFSDTTAEPAAEADDPPAKAPVRAPAEADDDAPAPAPAEADNDAPPAAANAAAPRAAPPGNFNVNEPVAKGILDGAKGLGALIGNLAGNASIKPGAANRAPPGNIVVPKGPAAANPPAADNPAADNPFADDAQQPPAAAPKPPAAAPPPAASDDDPS